MAEIAKNYSAGNELGCGFIGGIFQKWNHWPRKPHVYSLQHTNNGAKPATASTNTAKKLPAGERKPPVKAVPASNGVVSSSSTTPRKVQPKRLSDSDKARSSTSSSAGSATNALVLSRVVTDESKAGSARNDGNLKLPVTPGSASRLATMGNIVRRNSCSDEFRGVASKSDPEALKRMGNQAYKQGRFREALSLYDKAISLDSDKAVYRSNRSAALIGLGRFVEAVVECEEALRIEPLYQRAHHRLASLCLRLGEVEKALRHYKQSGSHATSLDVDTAQAIQKCLVNCHESRKQQNWTLLLKDTRFALSSGAISAPLVFALQAEALLRLLRHEEAYTAYQKGPNLSIDECTNFFGMTRCAYFLMIGSHVYLACGRFEDSVTAAQQAVQLDPTNKEVSAAVKRAKAISLARSNGNFFFNTEKFFQACAVYSHGLEHEPHNSVLLCNRAACRCKLGQFEKAIEDCTAALQLQPSYSKARLRRANCNAKLEKWEASVQDYEILVRETPGDEEVGKALFDARIELKRQSGEEVKDMKLGSSLVFVSTNERFRNIVASPGMSVVLFCNKDKQTRVFQALEQVCKRFPSVNFLKVEVEDYPYLVKTEGVSNIPAFKIYKNGSTVKEIPGSNHDLLESSVKWYSS